MREARRENSGDATRAGTAADARVAVCRDGGGGRNETPCESRTPRGARSERTLAAVDRDPIAARSLAETQSAARLLLGRASGFARTRRRCRRRASSPPARSTFARARGSTARTHSVGRVRPVGCRTVPARRVATAALQLWDAEQAECMLMEGGTQVVSFGTAWCGPCALSPPTSSPSATRSRTTPRTSPSPRWMPRRLGVATAHAVGAYPTTLWLREGREVHRLEGALPAAALVQLTAKHLLTAEEEEVLRVNAPGVVRTARSRTPRRAEQNSAERVRMRAGARDSSRRAIGKRTRAANVDGERLRTRGIPRRGASTSASAMKESTG